MKIEHAAYVMQDPVKAAEWYCEHLGFKVARGIKESPYTHFLLDRETGAMLEIYNNPKVQVPDYRSMDPLILHLAFETDDVEGERRRLIAAGAEPEGDLEMTPSGDEVAMLRDPWGFPVQLASRAEPMR